MIPNDPARKRSFEGNPQAAVDSVTHWSMYNSAHADPKTDHRSVRDRQENQAARSQEGDFTERPDRGSGRSPTGCLEPGRPHSRLRRCYQRGAQNAFGRSRRGGLPLTSAGSLPRYRTDRRTALGCRRAPRRVGGGDRGKWTQGTEALHQLGGGWRGLHTVPHAHSAGALGRGSVGCSALGKGERNRADANRGEGPSAGGSNPRALQPVASF